MVKTIFAEHQKYDQEEPKIAKKSYDDFLDKFAIQDRKNAVREQVFKFVTTETNRDNHLCELILRKAANEHKIKLTHYSGSFDYSAFQAIWHFKTAETTLANRIFDTIAFTLNGIEQDFNKTQKHGVSLVPVIREAIKPIAETHQYRKNILSLDEADLQQGETNWGDTIYSGRNLDPQEVNKKTTGYHEKANIKRTVYTGRNSKTTKVI